MTVTLQRKQALGAKSFRQPPLNETERKGPGKPGVPVSYFAALVRGGWLASRPVGDGETVTGRCPSATTLGAPNTRPRPRRGAGGPHARAAVEPGAGSRGTSRPPPSAEWAETEAHRGTKPVFPEPVFRRGRTYTLTVVNVCGELRSQPSPCGRP